MFIRSSRPGRVALVISATALTFGAAACGSDDDGGDDAASATTAAAAPTTAAAAPTTGASDDTAAGGGGEGASVEAFCEAELVAEAAAQGEDPAAAGPAFEALVAASPEDIRAAVEGVIANVDAAGSPAFDEPYAEVIQYMKDNCGYNEMEVTAADYSFTGVPSDVAAGGVIITMENTGEELHEVALWRVNDDATESAEEILALGEEEVFTKVTPAGAAFAFPGATGFGTGNLEPGRYLAVCSIPEGLTPEVAEQFSGPEATAAPGSTLPELGAPHHTLGMVAEFTVT